MEVDISYTGNLHRMRNAARGAPGRLEYIPTVAPASRPAVPEASRLRDDVSTQNYKTVSEGVRIVIPHSVFREVLASDESSYPPG
jgi:hypothetical protein